ncbi:uncharacterized protein LOC130623149 [Hydractinia symbiolongicarpus]|uniref:uncharacterized protein LOC130623149 n=1 Tax=Hydractinia symbiolongicarpus TaxID=13093 RepID=UPI00254FD736|nr:uncharacterized protein LOC130623149 [Hydractinia symbiolongicarpus]
MKENCEIFADFLLSSLNKCLSEGGFLKEADVIPIFKKGFSTQHCLLAMLEKWRKCNDENKIIGALLTDLSKAFDCLPHDLLIAKLNAYGFDEVALKIIYNYFVYLCDLFFMITEVEFASFADDTTPYTVGESLNDVIKSLKKASSDIFKWFELNQVKANPEKCDLIFNVNEKVQFELKNNIIESSPSVRLLGVKIDNKLNFEEHVRSICKSASQKLHALARISPYMNINKKKMIPQEDCECTAIIKIGSIYKQGSHYYIQTYLEECKYKEVERYGAGYWSESEAEDDESLAEF